jgi:hypothetical protein
MQATKGTSKYFTGKLPIDPACSRKKVKERSGQGLKEAFSNVPSDWKRLDASIKTSR